MKEAKFTKGPWSYHQSNASRFASIKSGDKLVFVFRCEPRNMHDVKLIAAAPEMYEHLALIQSLIAKAAASGHLTEELFLSNAKTNQLLTKARGES